MLVTVGAPVAVAVPLAALAFLYVGAHGKVVDQQSQLDAAKAELAALPQPTAPVIDSAVVGDEAVRATAVANVLGGRLAWEAVFRDMSKVLPANVWLSTLALTAPEATNLADGAVAATAPVVPGAQAVPTAVAMDGFTFSQPDVARLLARLATLPSLKRVTLTSSQSQLVGSKKVVHFAIVADLNQTGGAS
jgi:Tfp pilus assembly protein PilN